MRPLRFALAPAAAIVLAAAPACAATYSVVAWTPDTWTVVDPAAAEILANGVKRLFSITVQKSISPTGVPTPGYVKTLSEYDCQRNQSRWVEFTLYDRSGAAMTKQKNPDPRWSAPASGADAGSTLTLLCNPYGAVGVPTVFAPSLGDLVIRLFARWDEQTGPPRSDPPTAPPASAAPGAKGQGRKTASASDGDPAQRSPKRLSGPN
jgi:hypothetical protein